MHQLVFFTFIPLLATHTHTHTHTQVLDLACPIMLKMWLFSNAHVFTY